MKEAPQSKEHGVALELVGWVTFMIMKYGSILVGRPFYLKWVTFMIMLYGLNFFITNAELPSQVPTNKQGMNI